MHPESESGLAIRMRTIRPAMSRLAMNRHVTNPQTESVVAAGTVLKNSHRTATASGCRPAMVVVPAFESAARPAGSAAPVVRMTHGRAKDPTGYCWILDPIGRCWIRGRATRPPRGQPDRTARTGTVWTAHPGPHRGPASPPLPDARAARQRRALGSTANFRGLDRSRSGVRAEAQPPAAPENPAARAAANRPAAMSCLPQSGCRFRRRRPAGRIATAARRWNLLQHVPYPDAGPSVPGRDGCSVTGFHAPPGRCAGTHDGNPPSARARRSTASARPGGRGRDRGRRGRRAARGNRVPPGTSSADGGLRGRCSSCATT